MDTLVAIRKEFRAGRFEFSEHAVDQSIIREISVREVQDAIAKSEVIEDYPADKPWNEILVEKKVTYHIEFGGRLFLIEHVPARVNLETGEKHFSPETVERLHQIVREERLPVRTIETPVYEYEATPPAG